MDVWEVGCKSVDWNNLTLGGDVWYAVVDTVITFVLLKGWISLDSVMCGCIYHNSVWFHVAKLSI